MEDSTPGCRQGWRSYLGAREKPPLEVSACPPLDVLEREGGWAGGMGVQEGTMIQRCPEDWQ